MNLMRTLAQRGIKVALVDADLRRSMVNSDYGLKYEDGRSDDKGLSHFLAGMVGMEEVIYQTDIPGALMVPVGRDVPNPLALLTNQHFAGTSGCAGPEGGLRDGGRPPGGRGH